jgi:integrase
MAVMQRQEMLFTEAIRAKDTRRLYLMSIDRFKRETGIKAIEKQKLKVLQQKIIDYTIRMKKEGRSYSTQNNMLAALQKFAVVYDIPNINFKHIRQYMGENIANHQDRPYNKEELQKMIEISTPRMKAIILLMLSSGCRVGALPEMKVGDLKKHEKERLYQIRVYSSSKKDAYTAFCSVEATQAIDKMLELRKGKGEIIKPESPLFRSDLEREGPKAITKNAINQLMFRLLRQTGIRKPSKDRYQRQGTMLTHSFRKLANTAFVRAGVKPVVVEMLLGHDTGLQANYLRLSEDELLAEYQKAMDLVTVSEEKELRVKVQNLQMQNDQLVELLRNKVAALERANETRQIINDEPKKLG